MFNLRGISRGSQLGLWLALIATGAGDPAFAGSEGWHYLPPWARIGRPPAGDEGANVLVLKDSIDIRDGGWETIDPNERYKTLQNSKPEKYARLHHYRRLLILNEQGVRDLSTIRFPHEDFDELEFAEARVTTADSIEHLILGKQMSKVTTVAANGGRVELLALVSPALAPGCIVEYQYTTKDEFEYQARPFAVQEKYPVLRKTLIWRFREAAPLDPYVSETLYSADPGYVILNREGVRGQATWRPTDERNRLVVEFSDVPALWDELDAPPTLAYAPILELYYSGRDAPDAATFWGAVATGAAEQQREFCDDEKGVRRFLGSLPDQPRDEDKDVEECLSLIHRHFHPDARFGASAEARETPTRSAKSVLSDRRPGPGDLSGLLVCMLTSLGYDAAIAYGSRSLRGQFDPELKTFSQFDTRCVAIAHGKSARLVLPELVGSDAHSLPWALSGGHVVLARTEEQVRNALEVVLPVLETEPKQNRISVKCTVDLRGPKPRAAAQVEWDCAAEAIRRDWLATAPSRDAIDACRAAAFPGLRADDAYDEQVTTSGRAFTYSCSLKADGWVDSGDGWIEVRPGVLVPENREYPESRRAPLDYRYPRRVRMEIAVQHPGEASSEVSPPILRSTEWSAFSVNDAGTVSDVTKRTITVEIREPLLAASSHSAVREFWQRFSDASTRPLTISLPRGR